MSAPPTVRAWARTLALAAAAVVLPRAEAQVRVVEFIGFDYTEVVADSAGTVRRLSGNVRFRQDTTQFRADRVVQYVDRGLVNLTGSVRIVSGRDTLTARRVVYDSNTKVSLAEGDVRIGNGESVLRAPSARYDSRAEVSAFEGGGTITSDGSVLTAPSGTYDSGRRFARLAGPVRLEDSTGVLDAARGTYDARVRRADFAGEVRLRRPDARLHADSVVYFRRTERARAYGRVALQRIGEGRRVERAARAPADSSGRTFLFGEALLFDGRDNTAAVRGSETRDPLLLILKADSTGRVDTTLARAPRLDVTEEVAGGDTLRVLTAAGGARLTQRDFASRADSVRLVRTERPGEATLDRFSFYGAQRPRVWADGSQLTADTLLALARGETVETVSAIGTPFAARLDSTLGRVQQLRGRRMQAVFDGERLRRLDVWPNAEAIYYSADGEGRLSQAIEVSSDSLSFLFVEGEVRDVGGYKGIQGTMTPGKLVTAPLRLAGFAFSPRDAPSAASVLEEGWEAEWLGTYGPTPADLAPPPTAREVLDVPGAPRDAPSSAAEDGRDRGSGTAPGADS